MPNVHSLHRQGWGYRRIANELESDGLSVDWTTVRRLIKSQNPQTSPGYTAQVTSTTILPLGPSDGMREWSGAQSTGMV